MIPRYSLGVNELAFIYDHEVIYETSIDNYTCSIPKALKPFSEKIWSAAGMAWPFQNGDES